MEKPLKEPRDRWIGVYIGVLAVLLAICSMGGGNASKDAARFNLDATNLWAFFQAKNLRRTAYLVAIDELELQRMTSPSMPAEGLALIDKRLTDYRQLVARLTSDKERNEGLDELWARAKALEEQRDEAMRRDPYFDYGEAFIQIAIVLASIALITGGSVMLVGSGAMGVIGVFAMVNGFTLLAPLAFVG